MKFRPFTHVPGTSFLLPGTNLVCRIYPALIVTYDGDKEMGRKELHFGPLEQFTVVQELEKGFIQLTGFAKDGFVRHKIEGKKVNFEKLYLGCDKQQKWPDIGYRLNMKELLPLWYALGQQIPKLDGDIFSGASLASNCKDGRLSSLKILFQAGFDSGFVPHIADCNHMGFDLPVVHDQNVHPLLLLSAIAPLIRALFFTEANGTLQFLPQLESELHAGSFANIKTLKGHSITFDWSKHLLRTVSIIPACDDTITLKLQKEIKKFRVRGQYLDKNVSLQLEKGKKIFLDNFLT